MPAEPEQRDEGTGEKAVGGESKEGVEEEEAVILKNDEESDRDAGVVENDLCPKRRGAGGVAEMEEGEREEEQTNGGRGGDLRAEVAEEGQYGEAAGERDKREAVDIRAFDEDFAEVEQSAKGAEDVAGKAEGTGFAASAEIEKDCGQQAETGEGNGSRGVGPEGRGGTDSNADEQAEVPAESEQGGKQRQDAHTSLAATSVAIDQQEEYAKDEDAGRVADGVDPVMPVEINFGRGHFDGDARLRGRTWGRDWRSCRCQLRGGEPVRDAVRISRG